MDTQLKIHVWYRQILQTDSNQRRSTATVAAATPTTSTTTITFSMKALRHLKQQQTTKLHYH